MQGYLPAIIAITVFVKLIKFALPKENTVTKYFAMFSGLCITAVMAVPVIGIIEAASEFKLEVPDKDVIEEDYSEIFGEHIAQSLYPSVEDYVYTVLSEKFSVPRENAEVFIRFNTSGDVITLEQILIFLKNNSIFSDTGKISLYFEERFLCPVDVSVDIP